ncbi:CAP domain-containing protein [Streptomyces sp. NPDC055103]
MVLTVAAGVYVASPAPAAGPPVAAAPPSLPGAEAAAPTPERRTDRAADRARQPGVATGAGAEAGTGAETGAGTGSGTDGEAAGGQVSEYVRQVVALANAERERAGCGLLRTETRLRTAAQGHADDMAARDYYEHDSPEGRDAGDRMTGAGYAWSTWGENIHRGPKTPAQAMDDWMDSPGHRENILNCSFKDIGVGVTLTADGPWWVQNFGAKG